VFAINQEGINGSRRWKSCSNEEISLICQRFFYLEIMLRVLDDWSEAGKIRRACLATNELILNSKPLSIIYFFLKQIIANGTKFSTKNGNRWRILMMAIKIIGMFPVSWHILEYITRLTKVVVLLIFSSCKTSKKFDTKSNNLIVQRIDYVLLLVLLDNPRLVRILLNFHDLQ